ncbi:putative ABC transport system permease protein [Clostridium beijerinckii]|uniref:FtsX-like permease family protein n=1 Tax=Clostridium beijerinckii TaxID=1520 RepID=UPI0015CED2FD|nr:ABC transporter permease [Clostridium beijerinckii]NYC71662.1 putative ABC transport system permease protein [Clostridium beijerinckii]
MSVKYCLKNLYIRKKIMLLLLFQAIVYIFFLMNLFSMSMFKSNFTKNYKENFPLENGAYIKDGIDSEKLEKEIGNVRKFIDYIEDNKNIKSYRLSVIDRLSTEEFNINTDDFKQQHTVNMDYKNFIPLYRINYGYYSEIEKNIYGSGLKKEDFDKDNEFTPVILGEIFKKNYKIGDIISNDDKSSKFKVVGFLKKDILILDGMNPAESTKSSEKGFIIPLTKTFLNEENYMLPHSMKNMVFTFNNNLDNSAVIKQIIDKGKELGMNLEINNFYDSLNTFINDVDIQIRFESVKVLIYTLLSFGVFTLSFIYLINNRKREVGILYSLGASKKNIIFMFCLDMVLIIGLAYLLSIPIYMYFGETVIYFFINDFNIINLGAPFLIMLLISLLSLIIPINNIIKLKPNELIRGR